MNAQEQEIRILNELIKSKLKQEDFSNKKLLQYEKETIIKHLSKIKNFISKIKENLDLKKKILFEKIISENVNNENLFSNKMLMIKDVKSNKSTTYSSNKQSLEKNQKIFSNESINFIEKNKIYDFKELEKENINIINKQDDNILFHKKIHFVKNTIHEIKCEDGNKLIKENYETNQYYKTYTFKESNIHNSSNIVFKDQVISKKNTLEKLDDDEIFNKFEYSIFHKEENSLNNFSQKFHKQNKKNYFNHNNILNNDSTILTFQVNKHHKFLLKSKINFLYKKIIFYISFKKFLLIKHIIFIRNKMALRLQTYFRMQKKRKQLINIFEKDKYCYMIKSKLKYAKHLQLKVLFKDKSEKKLEFEMCPIRNTLVLYIEKKFIQEPKYYVNFIADGNTIIDPLYASHYDSKGNFYNIIDFQKLEEEQREKELERDYFYGLKGIESLKEKNKGFFGQKQNLTNNDENEYNYLYSKNIYKDKNLENFSGEFSYRDDSSLDFSGLNNCYKSSQKNSKNKLKTNISKKKHYKLNNNNENGNSSDDYEEEKTSQIKFENLFKRKNEQDNYSYIEKNYPDRFNTSVEEFESQRKQKKSFGTDMNLTNLKKRNSIAFPNANERSSFNINSNNFKHVYSFANLNPQKSILKSPSSGSKPNIPKRVSFGKVQFSC